ncbi:MAG: peptidase, partial [Firmicutes bacterium]|nr:peptidase [Bacillota bacterium]
MGFLSSLLSPIALGALEVTLIVIAVIILGVIAASFRLVTQTKKVIVERLGGYYTTWGVGLHFLIPILDRQVKTVSLKEQVRDFDPQPVITRDNVTMQIDTVVFFAISDPKAYVYGVENPMMAIENIS